MAFLGIQLVITMVMASFLQKLSPHFSPARWILCKKLTRYLHPSDEELRSLSGLPSHSNKGKKRGYRDRNENNQDSSFMVPKNADIQLESTKVDPLDVMQLHFYSEFQWLGDFAVCTLIVYVLTEVYYTYFPVKDDEINLSLMWCMLVLAFAAKVLFSVTALYFRGAESSGERAMCITSAFFFIVLAMGMIVLSDTVLDFGLEAAFSRFMKNLAIEAENVGLQVSNIPTSSLGLRINLVIWCGIIGAFFTFPGLRLAKMHHDSLRFSAEKPFTKLIFNLSFVAPLIVSLLWVKPIARDYFTNRLWPGMTSSIMSPDVFETTRLLIIVAVVLLRLCLMPLYLQSYLNMAYERVEELKREAGKINSLELQRRVSRVFYYLCVVAVQYLAPLLMCLNFVLLLKTLGGHSWSSVVSDKCMQPVEDMIPVARNGTDDTINLVNLKNLFTPVFCRGIIGFMTWWVCSVWFATSAIGLVYYSYFVE